jgi:general stress protein 26
MAADAADHAEDRAWELMEKIGMCMLITTAGSEVRARPMAASVKRDDHAVYFLTNADSAKAGDIATDPAVTLAFADASGQKYVSLRGSADVTDDRALIKSLWTPFAKAWWDSPDDPEIRAVRVTPESAEYWDSPGKIASYAKMLTAAVTGARPKVGDNETVDL